MPGLELQHPVVQPDPFLLPPTAKLCLRRGHGDGGPVAADAAAPQHAILPLARDGCHDPVGVAAVDAEERGGRPPGRPPADPPFYPPPPPPPSWSPQQYPPVG